MVPRSLFSGTMRSRGPLVTDWLKGDASLDEYLAHVTQHKDEFGAFNLLIGQVGKPALVAYATNRGPDPCILSPDEPRGPMHALSNGLLSDPWDKVVDGERRLGAALDAHRRDPEALIGALFDTLSCVAADSQSNGTPKSRADMRRTIRIDPMRLPSSPDGTKLSLNPLATQAWYGTRTATVCLVTRESPPRVIYVERDVFQLEDGAPCGKPRPERRYEFTLA